ncbi:thioredoxin family protein [Schleiferiaceae bacterium]|nr:thioredoxin family protein [Schleiferiaceae bacterium]MDA9151546.1 thioredoxin family protein [Schleiferiaceae bacterium]
MKTFLRWALLACMAWLPINLSAQIIEPVKWKTSTERQADGTVKLIAQATIEGSWHMYSQKSGEDGPLATTFVLTSNPRLTLSGGFVEPAAHSEFSKQFNMELAYFEHSARFVQTANITGPGPLTVEAEVSFQVCNDEMCLFPEYIPLTFKIPAQKNAAPTDEGLVATEAQIQADGDASAPSEEAEGSDVDTVATASTDSTPADVSPVPAADETEMKQGHWGVFLEGMGWGFLALLMPCIFPMIPLTVSFFIKQSKTRAEGISKAITYGISINVIYVALGLLITVVAGPDALNAMATDPWFNLFFFGLFVIFAISFFGAFEITLPSKWVDGSDNLSQRGGLIGIFFMAFTLALVSFSCTGPLIGSLLVRASNSGELLGPAMGMFGFSFALSLPFMLFAAFPGWLQSLPKSGGWMNTVKVVLGFLELAFAMKFLSTADMVWQAHWVSRELFLAIWTGLTFLIALYLFGAFRMPHDDKVEAISVPRMLFGTTFFILGFYLLPGTFGAPVRLVAGFPPPAHYAEAPGGAYLGGGGSEQALNYTGTACPDGLPCFNTLDDAKAYAKQVNKPIMIDFTGWGCVNCRKMEEQVWVDPEVHRILKEEVVLVSLYVDEKVALPESEQYTTPAGKKIKYVGQKWSDFEASTYGANAQPYYVILDPHGDWTPLNGFAAWDPDVPKFLNWLNAGIAEYRKRH